MTHNRHPEERRVCPGPCGSRGEAKRDSVARSQSLLPWKTAPDSSCLRMTLSWNLLRFAPS